MAPFDSRAAHAPPAVNQRPEVCVAVSKINPIVEPLPRSGDKSCDDNTKILQVDKWLGGGQEPWNPVSRGRATPNPSFDHCQLGHDPKQTPQHSLSDEIETFQPDVSRRAHHQLSHENHSQGAIDCLQLDTHKSHDEIHLSNQGQSVVDLGGSSPLTPCGSEIPDASTQLKKRAPRSGGQNGRSKPNQYIPGSKGRRKRPIEPDQDGEESFEEPYHSDDGPQTRRRCRQFVACPFYKADPDNPTYQSGEDHEKCRTKGVEAAKLKEHIRRRHTKPDQCETCGIRGEHGIIRKHQREVKCLVPEGGFEQVDDDTLKKDELMKPKGQSWSQIFKIQFPDLPVPDSEFVSLRVDHGHGIPAILDQNYNNESNIYSQHFWHWLAQNLTQFHKMYQQTPGLARLAAQHKGHDLMEGHAGYTEVIKRLTTEFSGPARPTTMYTGAPGSGLQEEKRQISTRDLINTGLTQNPQINPVDPGQHHIIAPSQSLLLCPSQDVAVGLYGLGLSMPTPAPSDNPSVTGSTSEYLQLSFSDKHQDEEGSSNFFQELFSETEEPSSPGGVQWNPSGPQFLGI